MNDIISKILTVVAIILGQSIGIAISILTDNLKRDGKADLAYTIDIIVGLVLLVGIITLMIIGKIKGFL